MYIESGVAELLTTERGPATVARWRLAGGCEDGHTRDGSHVAGGLHFTLQSRLNPASTAVSFLWLCQKMPS